MFPKAVYQPPINKTDEEEVRKWHQTTPLCPDTNRRLSNMFAPLHGRYARRTWLCCSEPSRLRFGLRCLWLLQTRPSWSGPVRRMNSTGASWGTALTKPARVSQVADLWQFLLGLGPEPGVHLLLKCYGKIGRVKLFAVLRKLIGLVCQSARFPRAEGATNVLVNFICIVSLGEYSVGHSKGNMASLRERYLDLIQMGQTEICNIYSFISWFTSFLSS